METKEPTVEQLTAGLIISPKEARKILGLTAKDLDDNQLIPLILQLEDLALELLNYNTFAN